MHELSVCQALIGQVERVAKKRDARRVVSIVIAVGPLSGVEAGLLEHAYPVAAAGTIAEHAKLQIEVVPVHVRCRLCGEESVVPPNRLLCANCGAWQVRVTSGEELVLKRVELEAASAGVH
jgi:hydrogenase nickel incorporation protein HypA/HybF